MCYSDMCHLISKYLWISQIYSVLDITHSTVVGEHIPNGSNPLKLSETCFMAQLMAYFDECSMCTSKEYSAIVGCVFYVCQLGQFTYSLFQSSVSFLIFVIGKNSISISFNFFYYEILLVSNEISYF